MRKAVIILPTYNEAGNIEGVVNGIFEQTQPLKNWQVEVLVVDSNSNDNTAEVVKKLQDKNNHVHLLNTKKEGLGKAYMDGFHYAIEKMQAYLIFEMDADTSHDPKALPQFFKKIEEGADFVIGSRYIKGGSIPKNWGIHRKILSTSANLIVRLGFMNLGISDWTGGFRAIKSWVVKNSLSHVKNYSGYIFQIALLDYALKSKARIQEVPIHFHERKYGISKINAIQYIFNTLLYILVNSSFIKFGIVGVLGFIIDFGISYYFIEKVHTAVWLATIMSTESAIIFNFFMNNYWSFSHKKISSGRMSFLWSFVKFNAISSGSIAIQTIGMAVLTGVFGKKLWYIYKFCIILFIVIPYSYYFYNKFIWKEK